MTKQTDLDSTAQRLVEARLSATILSDYPGREPEDLATAYACQDKAIALWPDQLAGWKVGIVPEARRAIMGSSHLVGPVFRKQVIESREGEEVEFPAFQGGSAAVEAEYVLMIARDVPPKTRSWSKKEAAALVGEVWTAVETAGSPLTGINQRGPAVVASDFGNNAGLILGRHVARSVDELASIETKTLLDGEVIGTGGASRLPGGPLGSLVGLLESLAARERWLRAGELVSTGATTGVHDVVTGQHARAEFEGLGQIQCRVGVAVGQSAR